MPKDFSFWLPVHEAGHIVVAMALGIEPNYAILKISPEVNRAYTSLPYPRTTSDTDEVNFTCAGMAAEIFIFRAGERQVPEKEFINACFDRSRTDRSRLFAMIDARSMGAVDDKSEDELMLSLAIRNVIPIIERNNVQFGFVRDHLIRYQFIARASLERIKQGQIPTEQDIASDHAQLPPDDPAWEVLPPSEQT